jgi:hypothetical protein
VADHHSHRIKQMFGSPCRSLLILFGSPPRVGDRSWLGPLLAPEDGRLRPQTRLTADCPGRSLLRSP